MQQPQASLDRITHECDILMPVYNGLSYVREAVESVLESTSGVRYRLLIVDDASDRWTARYLETIAAQCPQVVLMRQPRNAGFLQACIRGYESSNAPFICLLNSDVVVTPEWLERLLACAEADPAVAAVNPLTNHAANLAVPMLPGASFLGMDALLRARAPRYPDVVTCVGFCLLLRRDALRRVGFFDPVFGRGYCEESDLCMRLTRDGFRTLVADTVYVYHRGSASFGADRGAAYLHNRRIFDRRWSGEYRRQFAAFRAADPLRDVRQLIALPTRPDPRPVIWQTGRALRLAVRKRAPLDAARVVAKGLLRLPRERRPLPDALTLEAVSRPGRLRVTYLLPHLLVAGGILSVIQIVNALIREGVEARILTLFEDPIVRDWTRLYTRPVVFRDAPELIARCPASDLVVATHWTTTPWARAILDAGRARIGVSFLQDYEPWFFPETDRAARERVRATFGLLEHRIVKSDWLADMFAADGYRTRKIRLGMDLDCFYPRERSAGRQRVLAMARPGTPYRGFSTLVAALAQLKAARPEVEILLFGDETLRRHRLPFDFRDEGLIVDQDHLARTYASADVFVDASDFQGFGRCGLEAMACGAAAVLTDVGGVSEYARHDENALLVSPREPARLTEAVLALLDDAPRRARLAAAGLTTAEQFCHRREARETLAFFNALMESPT